MVEIETSTTETAADPLPVSPHSPEINASFGTDSTSGRWRDFYQPHSDTAPADPAPPPEPYTTPNESKDGGQKPSRIILRNAGMSAYPPSVEHASWSPNVTARLVQSMLAYLDEQHTAGPSKHTALLETIAAIDEHLIANEVSAARKLLSDLHRIIRLETK